MPSQSKKILIIEDEKPMARALELKHSHAGFETQIAWNGKEGLDLLKKQDFDLIILDLVMPEVDGFGVLQSLKDQNVATPVIVLSNLSQEEDEKRAKALGAKKFFIKSDTPIAEIVEQVKNFFE